MINALRTLLLNADGVSAAGAGYPGEEYVPPTFKAQALTGALATVGGVLFEQGADRALRNWRLREYLAFLHASELAGHVRALDPRITYLPWSSALLNLIAAGPRVSVLANPASQSLLVSGGPALPAANAIKLQWRLTVLDGANVQVLQLFGSGQSVTSPYLLQNGQSTAVALPGSTLTASFSAGVGGSWQVDVLAQPVRGLPPIVADLQGILDEPTRTGLFGRAGQPEPWATYRRLWEQHEQPAYRLGGVLLALGYQLAGQAPPLS